MGSQLEREQSFLTVMERKRTQWQEQGTRTPCVLLDQKVERDLKMPLDPGYNPWAMPCGSTPASHFCVYKVSQPLKTVLTLRVATVKTFEPKSTFHMQTNALCIL